MTLSKTLAVVAMIVGSLLSSTAYAATFEDELLAVDRAFNKMAAEEGLAKAFAAFMSDDARLLSERAQPVLGRAASEAAMAALPETATLSWSPVEAVASKDGTMGFTWGRFVSTYIAADGSTVTGHGKYVSIWQRQADGTWKWSVDMGNSNPPPPAETED